MRRELPLPLASMPNSWIRDFWVFRVNQYHQNDLLLLREITGKDRSKGYDAMMSDGVSYIRTTAWQKGRVNGKPQCLLSWCLRCARSILILTTVCAYVRTYDTKYTPNMPVC